MSVLVTGCAGFIGYHTAAALLARGQAVVGIDSLNAYYDPALKRARLARLEAERGFTFVRADFSDRTAIEALADAHGAAIEGVVHLGAQAGVRYSLTDPFAYVQSNLVGQVVLLELARHRLPALKHFVYASTSSVYGANEKAPFSIDDRVDGPVSLYAATKRADELMTRTYSHLYRLKATALRFFTVYGPWGRPDMAAFIFADAILAGKKVPLFNGGDMERDFTYIDDIVAGVLAALDRPPEDDGSTPPHRVYNLGNDRPVALRRFLSIMEDLLGREADVEMLPMQAGDVGRTWADIEATKRDLGYEPKVEIEEGLGRFVDWYRGYREV